MKSESLTREELTRVGIHEAGHVIGSFVIGMYPKAVFIGPHESANGSAIGTTIRVHQTQEQNAFIAVSGYVAECLLSHRSVSEEEWLAERMYAADRKNVGDIALRPLLQECATMLSDVKFSISRLALNMVRPESVGRWIGVTELLEFAGIELLDRNYAPIPVEDIDDDIMSRRSDLLYDFRARTESK